MVSTVKDKSRIQKTKGKWSRTRTSKKILERSTTVNTPDYGILPKQFALISAHGQIQILNNNPRVMTVPSNVHLWFVAPIRCTMSQTSNMLQNRYHFYLEQDDKPFLKLTANSLKKKRLPVQYEYATFKKPGQRYPDMKLFPNEHGNAFTSGVYYQGEKESSYSYTPIPNTSLGTWLSDILNDISNQIENHNPNKKIIVIVSACREIITRNRRNSISLIQGDAINTHQFWRHNIASSSSDPIVQHSYKYLRNQQKRNERNREKYIKHYRLKRTQRGQGTSYEMVNPINLLNLNNYDPNWNL